MHTSLHYFFSFHFDAADSPFPFHRHHIQRLGRKNAHFSVPCKKQNTAESKAERALSAVGVLSQPPQPATHPSLRREGGSAHSTGGAPPPARPLPPQYKRR